MLTKPKSVKIRSLGSARKYGVAGRTLKEVLSKACVFLQVLGSWREESAKGRVGEGVIAPLLGQRRGRGGEGSGLMQSQASTPSLERATAGNKRIS